MDFTDQSYYKNFESLLTQIDREHRKLQQKIMTLQEENSVLRQELNRLKNVQQEGLEQLSDSDRHALRHQILGMISKIDQYLENPHP